MREILLDDWETRIQFIALVRSIWMSEHTDITTFFDYFTRTYGIKLVVTRIGSEEQGELTVKAARVVDEKLFCAFLLKHGAWKVKSYEV